MKLFRKASLAVFNKFWFRPKYKKIISPEVFNLSAGTLTIFVVCDPGYEGLLEFYRQNVVEVYNVNENGIILSFEIFESEQANIVISPTTGASVYIGETIEPI